MHRVSIVGVLCVAIVLAGCKVNPAPTTVSRLGAEYKSRVQKASYDGEYRLLAAQVGRRGNLETQAEPLVVRTLKRGQRLGFARPSDGPALALAGDETFPLQDGQAYVWEMGATPGQIDTGKTIVLVLIIAATVGIVVGSLSTVELGTTSGFYP